jgi:hypothetical protein
MYTSAIVSPVSNSAFEKEIIVRGRDREQDSSSIRQKTFCCHCIPAEIRDIYRGHDDQWKRLWARLSLIH